jgi:histidyl-tRNA synthetase
LFDFLDTHGLLPEPRTEVDAVVIPTGIELLDAVRSVAKALRGADVRAVTPLELGKEIQRADKAEACVVRIAVTTTPSAVGELLARRR